MMNAPQYWTLIICGSCLFATSFFLPVAYIFSFGKLSSGIEALIVVAGLFFLPQFIAIWAMLRAKKLKADENHGLYNG